MHGFARPSASACLLHIWHTVVQVVNHWPHNLLKTSRVCCFAVSHYTPVDLVLHLTDLRSVCGHQQLLVKVSFGQRAVRALPYCLHASSVVPRELACRADRLPLAVTQACTTGLPDPAAEECDSIQGLPTHSIAQVVLTQNEAPLFEDNALKQCLVFAQALFCAELVDLRTRLIAEGVSAMLSSHAEARVACLSNCFPTCKVNSCSFSGRGKSHGPTPAYNFLYHMHGSLFLCVP